MGGRMEIEERKRPGAVFAGFLAPFALLVATVLAFVEDVFADRGWRGGEYATAFVAVAVVSLVAGVLLKATAPQPWRSVGAGMVRAGLLGLVAAFAAVVVLLIALAQWRP
ncbi:MULTISPECIES: hypothetical protein [Actinokineospora]|uniref:Uncharacterized protein n=1 Tax=Actinokineospora fastidiosa TaxID=1816 RepID=A0A918LHF3_9PSEU|nr:MULTISPECIES: hypothetical protein [Actinokineospora]UVS78775.1 hypothetical protein Actkin_02511 [Actinokineospora sp. UTMC 2448]GGS46954.1 hypothetical protein GCM10010171_47700 [Actinokineospora fastidiosa]